MAVVNKSNITLGNGNIEFGGYSADGSTFQTYSDIGAIKGDVTIDHVREVKDFETGRPMLVILQEVIRESVTIKLTFAEINLGVIKQALGQGAITTSVIPTFLDGTSAALSGTLATGSTSLTQGSIMSFGGLPTHAYIGLRFTHRKPNGNRQVFEGYKASPTGSLSLPFKEADWSMFEATFRLLANTSLAAGSQYYQMFTEGQTASPVGY